MADLQLSTRGAVAVEVSANLNYRHRRKKDTGEHGLDVDEYKDFVLWYLDH